MTTHALSVPPAGSGAAPVTRDPEDRAAARSGGLWHADPALEALEVLYAEHWRPLVRLSVLLVGDLGTAEEVVQDAFVAVHRNWTRLREPEGALPYLRRTVVNRSRSVLRHRGVVRRHLARQVPPPTAGPADDAALADDRRSVVLEALATLPRRQREVVALRFYADLSEVQIADALGISRGAVKSHTSRASAALRASLADYWEAGT